MSEVLQSTHHPANIQLSGMCTNADRRKQSPYSVETPYGFHLDLDFLKYVDDIEKGNTIRKVYIHKKAKQQKCSTLPRNFSIHDTRFPSAESGSRRNYGDNWMATSSWTPTNRCKVTNIQELFINSSCNIDPVLSEPNMHDCRSVKTLSDTRERLKENGKSVPSWVKPPFIRATSMPIDFKELSLEEKCQILPLSQQKLKYLENDVFSTPNNPVAQENSTTSETTLQSNLMPTQVHQIEQQIRISQDKTKETEEQVKTISELKKQIFLLQEENKQLNIQIKNQQSTLQNTSYVLQRKANDFMDKTECFNTGMQCNSLIATISSELEEGQAPFSSKSPSSEFFLSNDKFEHEKTIDIDYQNEFASNFMTSEIKNFDPILHKALLQNSYAVGDSEHRMRDVGVQVTEEELGLVLVAHPSTERYAIRELRTTVSISEKQLEGGTQEHKLEQQGAVPGASKISLYPKTLQGDQSMHLEREDAQNQSNIRVASNQQRDGCSHGATEPKPSESKENCEHEIKSDLQPFTRSVGCGDCTVNVTVTTLKKTRSFGVNTDRITVNNAEIMAAVETSDKAMDAAVRVCNKAVENENAPSLHCIPQVIGVSNRAKEDGVRGDNIESNSDNLKSNKTRSTNGSSAVIENGKEGSVAADSQHGECEKEEDCQNSDFQVVTLDAFLQSESQLISTNPEIGQCIKNIEDLLCKQQSFLEQNYPELAQNLKKLYFSIGSLSSQLVNSLQPLSSSQSILNQSEESSNGKECEPAVFLSATLKSIMKKKDEYFKSSGLPAKKNLQFIGVNGGYETTSSEDSNSSEGSSDIDLEKECVSAGNETQHTDNKAEMSKDIEGAGHEGIQPTGLDATVNVMQHCSKRHELKLSLISACHNLKDHLNELGVTNNKHVRQNLNTVQWEWFRISSQKSAAPETIQNFLLELREMSPELLHFIVNLPDENQNTALHYSVSHSNFHIVRLLLDTGMCNVDHQNKAGYTATMLASLASAETDEELAVIMQLLHLGNVNIQATQAGQTALMLAVSHGRINMVKALLSYGANMNIQDDDGSTALMCASEHGHVEIVKLLLAQPGCNTALTDKKSHSDMGLHTPNLSNTMGRRTKRETKKHSFPSTLDARVPATGRAGR
ncbi:KN motif and ankyrin repeat domain-containing protein 4-like isoform X2 [Heterodontus francisci]|uniref:KN motif and ankyrin repeat domain-containing protein 4-like isoform X2 n=1 Tax=Heterodontus francisci TaxID=7792 RepID=UPI00355BC81A